MIKKFRAWDGKEYWYSNDDLIFINDYKALELRLCTFKLQDVDQSTGKIDVNGALIYENDIITMIMPKGSKIYQVVWSPDECGFRKVPYGMPMPETKIDEAFFEVIGTINSHKEI